MLSELLVLHPLLRELLDEALQDVHARLRYLNAGRELVDAFLDFTEKLVLRSRSPGQIPSYHLEENDSEWPEVDVRTVGFVLEDFGCFVVGRSTVCLQELLFFVVIELSCEAEVCQFDLTIFRQKNVGRLQVTMNAVFSVENNHSICDLLEQCLSFELWKWSMLLEILHQITTFAQLEDEIDWALWLLESYELANVAMTYFV